MGRRADGEEAGFSMTVPNWWKAVGVRSSIGIRRDGLGMEVGMIAFPATSGPLAKRWRPEDGGEQRKVEVEVKLKLGPQVRVASM